MDLTLVLLKITKSWETHSILAPQLHASSKESTSMSLPISLHNGHLCWRMGCTLRPWNSRLSQRGTLACKLVQSTIVARARRILLTHMRRVGISGYRKDFPKCHHPRTETSIVFFSPGKLQISMPALTWIKSWTKEDMLAKFTKCSIRTRSWNRYLQSRSWTRSIWRTLNLIKETKMLWLGLAKPTLILITIKTCSDVVSTLMTQCPESIVRTAPQSSTTRSIKLKASLPPSLTNISTERISLLSILQLSSGQTLLSHQRTSTLHSWI